MKNLITLEDVKDFPVTLPLETIGFHWLSLLLPIVGVLGLIAMHHYQRKNDWLHTIGHIAFTVGVAAFIAYIAFVPSSISPKEQDKYNAYYIEWLNDYVKPYIDTLPEKKMELTKVEYDSSLQEELQADYLEKGMSSYGVAGIPIKAIDSNGGDYSLLAEVVYEEGLETDYLTAHYLKENIYFTEADISHFLTSRYLVEAGLQNAVLYTGDPAFEKYIKEQDDKK